LSCRPRDGVNGHEIGLARAQTRARALARLRAWGHRAFIREECPPSGFLIGRRRGIGRSMSPAARCTSRRCRQARRRGRRLYRCGYPPRPSRPGRPGRLRGAGIWVSQSRPPVAGAP
jgi:hypothetical protein